MKVTVTGGAGFIGSHLTEALFRAGHQVRVVDDLSTGNVENLKAIYGVINFVKGDVSTPRGAAQACSGVDVVYHLAAAPSVPLSLKNPKAARRACLGGTFEVIKAADVLHVKRLVFASTCAVYGTPTTGIAAESDCVNPLSPYAESKFAGEQLLKVVGEVRGGLDTVSLRLFNVYGPRQRTSGGYAAAIPAFADAYRSGCVPTIFGDGEQTRDFVFVGDVARAFVEAGQHREPFCGDTINIGSGVERSILSVCDAVRFWTAGVGEPNYSDPVPRETRRIVANTEKASSVLGFNTSVKLATGIESYVAWRRENQK